MLTQTIIIKKNIGFLRCSTDGVLLGELRMLCIVCFGLHRDQFVVDGSLLFENAGVHSWFDGAGHIFAHSSVYHATAGLSKCPVSGCNHFSRQHEMNDSSRISYYFRWPACGCRLMLRALGVTYEMRGIENIQRDRGAVVLINHQSAIDLAGTNALSLRHCFGT